MLKACQWLSVFSPGRSGTGGITRWFAGTIIFQWLARRSCGGIRAVANFRRLVAGGLGSSGMGCGSSVSLSSVKSQNALQILFILEACKSARSLSHLLRFDASKAGFCEESTIDVYRIACAVGVQFSGGASLPEELASVCAEREMEAMAVLDRDGMYGAPRFYLAAKKIQLRALIGAEVTSEAGWRYPLLVESRAGLSKFLPPDHAYEIAGEKRGRTAFAVKKLPKMRGGLICLTGGEEGPLAHALAHGGMDAATEVRSAALRNIWISEMCTWNCSAIIAVTKRCATRRALEIARQLNLPLLATNGFATRCQSSAKCSTYFRACAITAR